MSEQELLKIEINFPGLSRYAVDAKSVEDFVTRYYDPDLLSAVTGRANRIISDREFEMSKYGHVYINCRDSVTGKTVIYFG